MMQENVQYKFVFPSEEMAITFSFALSCDIVEGHTTQADEYLDMDELPQKEGDEFILWAVRYSSYSVYEKHQYGTDDPDNGECDHDPEAVELPAGYFVRRYKIVKPSGTSTHTPYMTYTEEWV